MGRDGTVTLRLLGKEGQVETLSLADYLWGVVAAEMPASFEEEALKAQAVCARTYTLWKLKGGHHGGGADVCADSGCCQAYLTRERAAEKWGERTAEYTARIRQAVAATDGQILTYGGEPIQAVFFSSSAPATEDAAAVWGNALPYLVSVDSPEGEEVPDYRTEVTVTAEALRAAAEAAGIVLTGPPEHWLGRVTRTASGRVAELELGGAVLSGGAVRSLLGLRSACFGVSVKGEEMTFHVTGHGHGVGMSQYGANAMARQGKEFEEILTWYYTGAQVSLLP
jgi:stage II sporulation protein D